MPESIPCSLFMFWILSRQIISPPALLQLRQYAAETCRSTLHASHANSHKHAPANLGLTSTCACGAEVLSVYTYSKALKGNGSAGPVCVHTPVQSTCINDLHCFPPREYTRLECHVAMHVMWIPSTWPDWSAAGKDSLEEELFFFLFWQNLLDLCESCWWHWHHREMNGMKIRQLDGWKVNQSPQWLRSGAVQLQLIIT